MDFFATGGFQQLLSDLHDVMDCGSKDYNNNTNNATHTIQANYAFVDESDELNNDYNGFITHADGEHAKYDDCYYYACHDADGNADVNDDDDDDDGLMMSRLTTITKATAATANIRDDISDGSNNSTDFNYHSIGSNTKTTTSTHNSNNYGMRDIEHCNAQLQQSLDLLLSSSSSSNSNNSNCTGLTDEDNDDDNNNNNEVAGEVIGDAYAANVEEMKALMDLDLPVGSLIGADDDAEDNNGMTLTTLTLTTTATATAAHITREMSEWEDKFLDNYIEIPELIDILPEKTPLCNEMCELFLHESSKQLKLSRRRHKAIGTATTTAETPTSLTTTTSSITTTTTTTTRSNVTRQAAKSKQRQKWPTTAGVAATATASVAIGPAMGYPCTYGSCQNVYAKPAHLKAHLRRHLGEKPYICHWPDCTWKFSRSDELARHRRSHSGVKPYKCVYCTKCFARSDHLTKHRKVHERRMLAASRDGRTIDGILPASVFTVRPGRKKKNQC